MASFEITLPTGEKFDVTAPDGAAALNAVNEMIGLPDADTVGAQPDQIQPTLAAFTPGNGDLPKEPKTNGSAVPGEPDAPGFGERLSERFAERGVNFQEIMAAQEAGEQTIGESIGQVVANVGIGAIFDTLGESVSTVASSAFDLLEIAAPEQVEGAREAFGEVVDTDLVQGGLEAASQGIEAYQAWALRNPRASRNLDAIANVALLFTPVKGKPAIGKPSGAIARRAEGLELKAGAQVAEKRTDFLNDLVKPKLTPTVKAERASRTAEPTLFRAGKVQPTAFEAEMAKNVGALPGISAKNGGFTNLRIIEEGSKAEAEVLKNAIKAEPFPVSKQAIAAEDKALEASFKESLLLTGDASSIGKRALKKKNQFIKNNPKTGAGVLLARKQFDTWVRKQSAKRGQAVLDPAKESAASIVTREIRQSMNRLVSDAAPNVAVKQSLAKQHSLITASENLTANLTTANVPKYVTAINNVGQALGLKGTVTGAALGLGIGANVVGTVIGGGVAVAGATLAAKAAATKTFNAKLLRGIDKAIKTTTDTTLLKKLRADRAAVLEIAREFDKEEE